MDKQNQKAGDNSTSIQIGSINQGLSYSEAKDLFITLFESNFLKLTNIAAEIADKRIKDWTDNFLQKLQKENPEGIKQATDPDFQYALYKAQEAYARSGDKELGNLLVNLLIERNKVEKRSIFQIILNEALVVAPKLTEDQIATLSLMFSLGHTMNEDIQNDIDLGNYFDENILSIIDQVPISELCYTHMEYLKCISILDVSAHRYPLGKLESKIRMAYQGLFFKGFDNKEIKERGIVTDISSELFIPCKNDSSKWQINAINRNQLNKTITDLNIDENDRPKIMDLYYKFGMSDEEVRTKCISIRDDMKKILAKWDNSLIPRCILTNVGITIGHANLIKLFGNFSELSLWINDQE